MGLDNGIMFKIKNKEKFGAIPSWFRREEWEEKYNYDYEVLYWRKCWNVRDAILNYLPNTNGDGGSFEMTPDQLEGIFEILTGLYSKENWNEDESIWSWEEVGENYIENLEYARKVLAWLKTKPEDSYQLYFYDSY